MDGRHCAWRLRTWAFAMALIIISALASASYGAQDPVARWTFSGDASDPGSTSVAVKTGRWEAGGSAEFDGIRSYMECSDASVGNVRGSFTIAFWVKPLSWRDQYSGGIVSKRLSDSTMGYVIYADGTAPTKINLRISGTEGGEGMLLSASDVDEGVWQHWAVSYDAATHTVVWYKNGRQDKVYRNVKIGDSSSDTPLQLGHAHTWNGFLDGALSDVRIYDRALGAAEVKSMVAAVPTKGLVRSVPVKWRVIKTRYATPDVVVAGCTVKDAGARGDGKTDDTEAFQSAMNTMARLGGGVVFVPEGRYVIKGALRIPTGVTLRGDWVKPAPGKPVRGSVLMAYDGRGETEGRPFIALRQCTGVKGLTIWYPEQRAEAIQPYPFCIQQMGSASGTVANVTLINAYQGIRTNYGSYLHYIHSVYGSPLAIGVEIDFVSDTGRVDDVHFGPDYWADSGLPGAPARGGAHAAWMREHGMGMYFRRYEWIFSAFVDIKGYATGIRMLNSERMGETNGQIYKYAITDCGTAIDIVNANFAGLSFTKCVLAGSEYGLRTRDAFNSRLLCHTCVISGGTRSALLDGIDNQSVVFEHCTLKGEVERLRGDLVLLGCSMASPENHVRLGEAANVVTIAGSKFDGEPRIVNECKSGKVTISAEPAPASLLPDFPFLGDGSCRPASSKLYVVRPGTKGADRTSDIQRVLDHAGKNGGGIVLLTGGVYDVRGRISVPSGVELRGVYDVEHHSLGLGSVLRVYAGRGNEKSAPTIVLRGKSGMRGLTFYYPEQRCDKITPYPYLIQGRGADVYVINVTSMNPYKMIDLRTYRCDRHRVEYAAGSPLRIGVAVGGGSVGGVVMNCQFNSNNWAWSPFADCPGLTAEDRARGTNPAWAFEYRNLDAFLFGDCRDEIQYQNAIFGSRAGLHFISENGRGASGLVLGHGTDGSLISMQFDGVGEKGIDVINSQLVSMNCPGLPISAQKAYIRCGKELNSTVRMFNTTLWGFPVTSALVDDGRLLMDMSAFCSYGPFKADNGQIELVGAFLGERAGEADADAVITGSGRVSMTGVLTPTEVRVDSAQRDAAELKLTGHRR